MPNARCLVSVAAVAVGFWNQPPRLDAQSFARPDSIVESGIRRGIFPGAVLVIGRRNGVIHRRGFGHFTWSARSAEPTADSTLWDLASLTKVVGTMPAVLRLVEAGRVDLDAPVSRYLPRFGGTVDKEKVTVRQLLNHTSGLPSYVEFFRLTRIRDSAIALLYRTPLRRPPGTTMVYSDLNFLLLGLLVESVTGEPLDQVVLRDVLAPAGMAQSRYEVPPHLARVTAPSGQFRGKPVCCRVYDQNAARMGGAAGHAGLFSTGDDLARYARLWLNEGVLDGRRVFDPAVVRRFLTPDSASATRLLGWERPDPGRRDDSAYGRLLSPRAYGHTGWTGTLLWIDPARDLFLILLCNRSHGPRMGHSIRALRGLRGALADAVVKEIGG
jgi:CubicO group peptidase (beta-lactamase class C family)